MKVFEVLCVLSVGYFLSAEGKSQYVESLNMGLQMAIPYDAANIFNRPIAGFTATFLSICLLFILFFGVITSPFGYMFGIPSRKYVLGEGRSLANWDNSSLPFDTSILQSLDKYDFANSMPFIPEDVGDECKLLLICYAHGFFKHLPLKILRFYQFFSRRLLNANEETKLAVKNGLRGTDTCNIVYSACTFDPFRLTVKTFRNMLPTWWGKRAGRGCSSWSTS